MAGKLNVRSRRNKKSIGTPQDIIEHVESFVEYPSRDSNTIDRKLAARFSFVNTSSHAIDTSAATSGEHDSMTQLHPTLQQPDWAFPRTTKRNSFASTHPSLSHSHSRRRSMIDWPIHDHKRRSLVDMMCDAASAGDVPQVGRLLGAGADARRKSRDGSSPLHLAAAGGHLAVLKSLIMHGARVEATDSDGRTALHRAVLGGQSSVIPYLIGAGVSIDAKDCFGCAAIHYAAQQSAQEPPHDLDTEPTSNERIRFSYVFGAPSASRRASICSTGSNHITPLDALLSAGVTYDRRSSEGSKPLDRNVRFSELRSTSELLGLENDSRSRL
jgi:hypothetical protein